jgi:hypothetical protein
MPAGSSIPAFVPVGKAGVWGCGYPNARLTSCRRTLLIPEPVHDRGEEFAMKGKRLLIALVAAAVTFGIVSAVQASIPDGNGVVHACFNTSNAHGYPTGALRAIDTDNINGHCASWEGAVDLATPQFVTQQINQTSFMFRGVFPGTVPGQWEDYFFCPAGYIGTDGTATASNQDVGQDLRFTPHGAWNHGEVATGTPDGLARYSYVLSATTDVTIHATCVDGRVFGLPGPAAPIKQAMSQASMVQKQVP